MDQSSIIGASLVIAYVVFVIYKGALPCWLSILGIASATKCPPNLQQPGCSGAASPSTSSGAATGPGIVVTPIGTTSGNINLPGGGSVGNINFPGGRGMSL